MRLIPGKTKVQVELFKGVSLMDVFVGGAVLGLFALIISTSINNKFYIGLVVLAIGGGLLFRLDEEPTYIFLAHMVRHFAFRRVYAKDDTVQNGESIFKENALEDSEEPMTSEEKESMKEAMKVETEGGKKKKKDKGKIPDISNIIPFTGISDNAIEYAGQYFGAVIEIPPVEFRFMSEHRRNNSIENGVGRVLRAVNPDLGFNIVKLERPMMYDSYRDNEYNKLEELKKGFEQGALKEDELKSRVDVIYDRINDLDALCTTDKVVEGFYYLVLYAENKSHLEIQVGQAMEQLASGELHPRRLNDKQLAVFLRYSNEIDFDEREIDEIEPSEYISWASPKTVEMTAKTVEVNHIITHNMRIVSYPTIVSNAWLATVMSIPGTKVVVKCKPMENAKAVKGIDRTLQELRGQYSATSVDSKLIEIQEHIQTLGSLLTMLQGDNEVLLETNVYITVYDLALTRKWTTKIQPPESDRVSMPTMKKSVRRTYQENGFRLNGMDFNQVPAFIGSQVSAYDPLRKDSRGIPSNTIAAMYPWIFACVSDKKGFKLGASDGIPVFIDFFRRDSERVNSNMVIIGKSGSGKSYATKSLLTNLAADDSKIFILDPENEYTDLAANLHGKFINVGNAQYGRLNPFHIITALDDEDSDEGSETGSYSTHLQFLEEFFKQVLPDCEKDAMEYLNSLVDRMYYNKGITPETDLSTIRPEDYPIFDDLYDEILSEFQQTDNEYIRRMLRTLVNYVSKFASGGRNSTIWNGPSTITTEENFTVFNFQSLLANRNGSVANAQMLLVLKYIDNEIIKNREYNTRYGCNRKVVVVIDEAHVFIDPKYPVALDFMFQLAKRIRKYNGMQIVITQNIKDFVGSEEIARKSTAIINACQYSFIFSLAPNDMTDLCKLYEKAGGINENEQEQIIGAGRGQAFTIMSPTSRSSFKVVVPKNVVSIFSDPEYESGYFIGDRGAQNWEDFVAESRLARETNLLNEEESDEPVLADGTTDQARKSSFTFLEVDDNDENRMFEEASKPIIESFNFVEEEQPEEVLLMNQKATDQPEKTVRIIEEEQPADEESRDNIAKTHEVVFDTAQKPAAPEIRYVQTPSVDSSVVKELSDMVSQLKEMVSGISVLSYETIMDNVRHMIEDSSREARELAEQALANASRVQPQETVESLPEAVPEATEEEEESGSILGNIFEAALGAYSSDEPENATDEAASENNELDDVLAELTGALSSLQSVSKIDMMDAYGEDVIEVTVEELGEYIIQHNLH